VQLALGSHDSFKGKGRKNFFFEKKKQKTFINLSQLQEFNSPRETKPIDKSFLVLFFKKELLFLSFTL
jgi:hypothetical protein